MPINLTTVPEGNESRRWRRRRKNRTRKHMLQATAIGVGMLALLVVVLALQDVNWNEGPGRRADPPPASGTPFEQPKPGDPTPVDKTNLPPEVDSAVAVSSGELAPDRAKGRIHSVRRVSGAKKFDSLQVEYEFFRGAAQPNMYVIQVRTPGGSGPVTFKSDAARRDVVELSMALHRLGSQGPIEVWLETLFPRGERVSNVMTLP